MDLPPGVVQGEVIGVPHIEMAPQQRLNFTLITYTRVWMSDTNHEVQVLFYQINSTHTTTGLHTYILLGGIVFNISHFLHVLDIHYVDMCIWLERSTDGWIERSRGI